MADTDNVDLDKVDAEINQTNSVEKRIKDLSQKVKDQAELAEANAKGKTDAEARAIAAEKERDFYSSFADVTSKYPNAHEFKNDILAKVKSGYDVDDAAVAVLAKAGKLTSPPAERETIAGGSAVNLPPRTAPKNPGEMTQADRRAALIEAENRGDISVG